MAEEQHPLLEDSAADPPHNCTSAWDFGRGPRNQEATGLQK